MVWIFIAGVFMFISAIVTVVCSYKNDYESLAWYSVVPGLFALACFFACAFGVEKEYTFHKDCVDITQKVVIEDVTLPDGTVTESCDTLLIIKSR